MRTTGLPGHLKEIEVRGWAGGALPGLLLASLAMLLLQRAALCANSSLASSCIDSSHQVINFMCHENFKMEFGHVGASDV